MARSLGFPASSWSRNFRTSKKNYIMAVLSWTIEDFPKLVTEETATIDSPEFYGGTQDGVHTRWQLQLCHKDSNANISVYLKLTRANYSAVSASFNVTLNRIGKLQSDSKIYDYMNDNSGSGWIQIPSTNMQALRDSGLLLADDKLRVSCNVYSVDPAGTLLNLNLPISNCFSPERFWAIYEQCKDSDMKIVVGDKEFSVHKFILRSQSKVFDAMLDHNVVEATNCRVEITDFDANTIKKLIEFIYTGGCGDLGADASELLKCADKYDIPALKSETEVALVRQISVAEAPALLELADVYGAHLLKEYTLNFIKDNLREVMMVDYWNQIPRPLIDEVIMRKFQDNIKTN